MQLDAVVVHVVAVRTRRALAPAAILQRDLDLTRHEDVELQVAQHGPEHGQGGGNHGDVDFEGGEHDGRRAVPRGVESWVGGCLGTDDGGETPYRENACTNVGGIVSSSSSSPLSRWMRIGDKSGR